MMKNSLLLFISLNCGVPFCIAQTVWTPVNQFTPSNTQNDSVRLANEEKASKREQMSLLKQQIEAEQKSKNTNEIKGNSNNQQTEALNEYLYKGFIGSYPIHFQFKSIGSYDCPRGGSTFEGFYYYDKSGASNKLLLKGYCCGASIHFIEYNASGNSTGSFSGIWGGDEIEGSWSNADKKFAFKLKALDSETGQAANQNTNETTSGIDYSQLDPDEAGDGNEPVTYNATGDRVVNQPAYTTETSRDISSPPDNRSFYEHFLEFWQYLRYQYRLHKEEVNSIAIVLGILAILIIILNQRKHNTLLKEQNNLLERKVKNE